MRKIDKKNTCLVLVSLKLPSDINCPVTLNIRSRSLVQMHDCLQYIKTDKKEKIITPLLRDIRRGGITNLKYQIHVLSIAMNFINFGNILKSVGERYCGQIRYLTCYNCIDPLMSFFFLVAIMKDLNHNEIIQILICVN